MPVNAGPEYYKAEQRFQNAKTREEKMSALEEMIRTIPKHKGTENVLSQLKSKLSKMRKEGEKRGTRGKALLKKEGEAQVCIVGLPNSGKSTLIARITSAAPKISPVPYSTQMPFVAMMDYKGVKIQLVEIPSTFEPAFMSIAKTAELIVIVARNDDERKGMESILEKYFVRTKHISMKSDDPDAKIKIWSMLGLIAVYTKKRVKGCDSIEPMALTKGSTVHDFAMRIHRDFVANFRFARLWRAGKIKQVGLNFPLIDGDIVEIYVK